MLFDEINALFIHIPKTAGLSIEASLLQYCNGSLIGKHHNRYIDLPQNLIDENFTFSFVRNPWDRFVSYYHFIGPGAPIYPTRRTIHHYARYVTNQYVYPKGHCYKNISFKEFVFDYLDSSHCPREIRYSLEWDLFDWLGNSKGEIELDFIGRFAELESDFKTLCEKLDIVHLPLPYANQTEHANYTNYYDSETRSHIAEKYSKEIEYFDFKFGD